MARSGGRSGAYGGDSGSELACRGLKRVERAWRISPPIHHALAPAYSRLMARPRRVLSTANDTAICGLMLWMRRFWFLFRRYRIFSLTLQIICINQVALSIEQGGLLVCYWLRRYASRRGQIICRLAQAAIIPRHQK